MASAIQFRAAIVAVLFVAAACPVVAAAQNLGNLVDVALDFRKPQQTLFAASRLTAFDITTGRGKASHYRVAPWSRSEWKERASCPIHLRGA